MNVVQCLFEAETGWTIPRPSAEFSPQLVLFFGGKTPLTHPGALSALKHRYPSAHFVGGSTSGEIMGEEVMDDTIVATAIEFADTPVRLATMTISEAHDSLDLGQKLATQLPLEGLSSVFVLADGHLVNGSLLVKGLVSVLGETIILTGGLAGDGVRFEETLVCADSELESGRVGLIGFYGDSLLVGHGSVGGWDPFGPERMVTKSVGNVLYELDGKPALELYKKYLGEAAEELPGSALHFPLMIRSNGTQTLGTVRTILSIDEAEGSMTFAGDIPMESTAQLMMANFDRLVEGAADAATSASFDAIQACPGDKLSIMVSCVGRKIVLGQRVADEVEAVLEGLGDHWQSLGFYSYGEISPHSETGFCDLHNQTMTITLLAEQAHA